MKIIARIHNDYRSKFGVPRQSGLAEAVLSRIVFEEAYREPEALRGVGEFSHLWLLWLFDDVKNHDWSPTVRPPKLGGNKRVGVFATRSPYRPNNIGLTCVKLVGIEDTPDGKTLVVSGADMTDGTPIIDIKPYLAYADSVPDAVCGFADEHKNDRLDVVFDDRTLCSIPENKREALTEVLSLDPRPSYHDDPARVYGLDFGGFNVRFTVCDGTLHVVGIEGNN